VDSNFESGSAIKNSSSVEDRIEFILLLVVAAGGKGGRGRSARAVLFEGQPIANDAGPRLIGKTEDFDTRQMKFFRD
jgi:hypothetical protein